MSPQDSVTRPRFQITVDTETYAVNGTLPPFDTQIYAEIRSEMLGVPKIMEICDRRGIRATFFVDVYMHRHYGEEKVERLCAAIAARGHDVQLHAHTAWLPQSPGDNLSAFPYHQQVEILAEGRDLIRKWTGRAPVAFRAGAYAANLDTIRALEQTGFLADSSYFAFHRNCELSRQLGNVHFNRQFKIGGVHEFPVTVYWLVRTPFYRKLSKVDVNSSSLAELREVVPKLIEGGVRNIVLFLHSFSFIQWKRDFSGAVPNYRALERFEAILDLICQSVGGESFCSVEEACKDVATNGVEEPDFVPAVGVARVVPRALQRVLERAHS